MACRLILPLDNEYIMKKLPGPLDNIEWPIVEEMTQDKLYELTSQYSFTKISLQAIIQQYNEIKIYQDAPIQFKNILAPQCAVHYQPTPYIIYPKFMPLVQEATVWKTATQDIPVVIGMALRQHQIDFQNYKQFVNLVVDLCEEYGLREDDIFLNPSNIGYHPIFGLRLIDYGLTDSGQILDF